jgi:hypothetical protein
MIYERETINEGEALDAGTMVFWLDDRKPYWVIKFQPQNGNSHWLVDASGEPAVAGFDELYLTPP